MFWSKKFFLGFLFLLNGIIHAQVLLVGDSAAATGDSFSFDVLAKYFDESNSDLYIGRNDAADAGDTTDKKQYALSVIKKGALNFLPLAPEKAYVNGVANTDNPLFGQKISEIGFLAGKPLVVRSDLLTNLYYLSSGALTDSVILTAEDVKDANAATTAGIVKIAGSGSYAFAAVKPNGGDFGDYYSGIALIKNNTVSLGQVAAVAKNAVVKAVRLDRTTASLQITSDLASIDTSIIDMHWDVLLQRLYVCIQATGNNNSGDDGARGVVMGYVQTVDGVPKLNLTPFSPTTFAGTNYIVGAKGEDVVVDIQKVRTLHASTGVSYLITLGNAKETLVNTTVSALPLVNQRPASTFLNNRKYLTSADHGVLASKVINAGTNLKEYFETNGEIACFIGRGFQTVASALGDLTAQTEVPAKVGGGVAPGAVLDMQVFKDTVYVSVDGNAYEARVFSSQALFDVNGAIKAWTPWRAVMRPATGTDEVYGMGYQPSMGWMYTMEGATSADVKKVKTSIWSKPSKDGLLGGTTTDSAVGFESLLGSAFSKDNGGIQGLFDFPKETTAFSQTADEKLSMMIATGYKKIMLIETGQADGANFLPHVGNFNHADNITITDGVLNVVRTVNTKTVTISGGALDTVGAISTATIMNATTNGGYIIVGGVGGVAILRATTGGAGWTAENLQKAFNGIGVNKSFITLGSYSNVRKVIADGQYLYVLTDKTLDRIPASELNGVVTPITLATPSGLGLKLSDSFSDLLVSSKLALLATSKGLYRTGNGKNITTETTPALVDWTKITLSEGPEPVTRLEAVSTTMLETDFAKTNGGMVYVLAASVGDQLSAVYRLTTRDISGSAISATTVEFIPDKLLSSIVGPYAHLGSYKNYFTTDGALPVISRSKYNATAASVQDFSDQSLLTKPKFFNVITLSEGQTAVGKLVSNSALGSKIIPTNDGSLILE
jgi:hypothetical protein